jgi:hypothetical protein
VGLGNSLFDTSMSESACSQPFRTLSQGEILGKQKSFNSEDFSYRPFGGCVIDFLEADPSGGDAKMKPCSLRNRAR